MTVVYEDCIGQESAPVHRKHAKSAWIHAARRYTGYTIHGQSPAWRGPPSPNLASTLITRRTMLQPTAPVLPTRPAISALRGTQDRSRPCSAPDEVCAGLACRWKGPFNVSDDGTVWAAAPSGSATHMTAWEPSKDCELCRCLPRRWPVVDCVVTIIPTRRAYLMDPSSEMHGFGSRVNTALALAPYAMVKGFGFQMSGKTCANEHRSKPHCFFQPASTCGSRVLHMVFPDSEELPRTRQWQQPLGTRRDGDHR